MEFGQVEDLNKVDFKMPSHHPDTSIILKKFPILKKPLVYLGCAKWGRKDWIGKIYPEGTNEKDFLENYVKHYNSIELNATYHRIPSASVVSAWTAKARQGFLFCPKFPKIISHQMVLKGSEKITELFAENLKLFGEHLGPAFIQMPPFFSPKQYPLLLEFLELIKNFPTKVFIEFRHPDWFKLSDETEIAFDFIRTNEFGVVITDTAGRRDCLHQRLTIPQVFVRFVGNHLHETDFMRINDWTEKLNEWFQKGLQSAYFFIHNDSDKSEAFSPELSLYTAQTFNKTFNSKVPEPVIVSDLFS